MSMLFKARSVSVGSVVAAAILHASACHAAVTVSVRFVIVDREISPRQETHIMDHNFGTNFTMSGDEVTRRNGGTVVTAKLNQAFDVVLPDMTILTSYRMHGGIITETEITPHARRTINIRTNGVDSCSATVRFWKLAHNRSFVFNRIGSGETMYVSDRHAERVVCEISKSGP